MIYHNYISKDKLFEYNFYFLKDRIYIRSTFDYLLHSNLVISNGTYFEIKNKKIIWVRSSCEYIGLTKDAKSHINRFAKLMAFL
jgi:hypothetical protein